MLKLLMKKISEEKILKEKEKRELMEFVKKIELFKGNLKEYENMKEQKYKIIDNEEQDKKMMICLDWPYNKFMLENYRKLKRLNVEALIRYEPRKRGIGLLNRIDELKYPYNGKGIPVKKI